MRKSVIALLLCVSGLFAAEPPKLPKEPVYGIEGSFVTVDAEATGPVKWFPLDPGLSVVPSEELKNQRRLLATGKPGTYRVIAWTSDKDGPSDASEVTVVIKPRDNPPPPVDQLTKTLSDALSRESSKTNFKALGTVYADAAVSLRKRAPTTALDLFNEVVRIRNESVVKDGLPEVRKAVNAMVASIISSTQPDRVLKSSEVEAVAVLFDQVSAAINKLENK